MKIESLDLKSLRNEEHCQFMADAVTVIAKHKAEALQVVAEFNSLKAAQAIELSLLERLSKSFATDSLTDLDAKRDSLFHGLALSIESAMYHYDPSKVAVAKRISIVMKEYGNVARKTYNAESAALSKFTIEANTIYEKDFAALGLTEWISCLEEANNEFQAVMHKRYEEAAGKAEGNMKDVRPASDAAYVALCSKLDAYLLITSDAIYETVSKAMNAVVDKYANSLATRKGKNAANTEKNQTVS